MQIGHICSNNVVTCSSNTTVLEAAQLMRRNHVGTLIVVEEVNGMLVPQGIVTDRDIVVVVLAEGLDPKSIKVIDIMKVELMTAVETEDVFETVERMRFKGVRRIPIVDKMGGLVGIVSVDDIWKFLSKEISELADVTTRQQTREKVARRADFRKGKNMGRRAHGQSSVFMEGKLGKQLFGPVLQDDGYGCWGNGFSG